MFANRGPLTVEDPCLLHTLYITNYGPVHHNFYSIR